MVRYIVKSTATATENNPNFKGTIDIYYYGKEEYLFCSYSKETWIKWKTIYDVPVGLIEEYGYKRTYTAKQSYTYKHTEERYWKYETSIVAIYIDEKKHTIKSIEELK